MGELMWALLNRHDQVCYVDDRREPLMRKGESIFGGSWRNIRRRGDMSIRRVTVIIGRDVTCAECRYGDHAGATNAEPWSDTETVISLYSCRNGVRWWAEEPENPPWFGCTMGVHMTEEAPHA